MRAISSIRWALFRVATAVRFAAAAFLVHEQVLVALGGDLRQVGHGEDLAAFAEATQQLSDHFGGGASDADVDFVETRVGMREVCAVITWIARLIRDSSPPEATWPALSTAARGWR